MAGGGGGSLSLIIPAYNSARFLERNLARCAAYLEESEQDWELIVVDDCSTDSTHEIAERFRERGGGERVRVLRNGKNAGKGASVRRAMLAARGDYRVFTDADLTYPIENVGRIGRSLRAGADVAVACRVHEDSRYIVNAQFLPILLTRHLLGRAFSLSARLLLVGWLRDTQAGLKGFTRAAAERIFPLQIMNRFSFDVEVLFLARRLGLKIEEVGVEFIYSKEPSTIRFATDTLRMLRDMLRIRWRALAGRYDERGGGPAGAGDGGRGAGAR